MLGWFKKKEVEAEEEAPIFFSPDPEMEELCQKVDEYKNHKQRKNGAEFFRHIAKGIEEGKISVNSYGLEWGLGGKLTVELANQPEVSKVLNNLFYG